MNCLKAKFISNTLAVTLISAILFCNNCFAEKRIEDSFELHSTQQHFEQIDVAEGYVIWEEIDLLKAQIGASLYEEADAIVTKLSSIISEEEWKTMSLDDKQSLLREIDAIDNRMNLRFQKLELKIEEVTNQYENLDVDDSELIQIYKTGARTGKISDTEHPCFNIDSYETALICGVNGARAYIIVLRSEWQSMIKDVREIVYFKKLDPVSEFLRQ